MLLTSTEIISKSWDDYLKNWHTWGIFSLLIFLPSFVLMVSGSFSTFLSLYVPATNGPTDILLFLLVLLSLVFAFWTSLALVHASVKFLQTGKNDYWKEHFAAVVPSLWPAFYTSFFAGIFIFLGVIFFLVPGIIISVWYFFVIYNVITNDERGFKALASSKKLVTGRWWSVAWRIVLPSLFFGIAFIIIQAILLSIVDYLPFNILTITVLENVAKGVCSALSAPLTTLAGINLYYSLRDNPFREPPALLNSEPPTE